MANTASITLRELTKGTKLTTVALEESSVYTLSVDINSQFLVVEIDSRNYAIDLSELIGTAFTLHGQITHHES